MKRNGFKPKGFTPRPVKTLDTYTPRPRAVAVAVSDGKARMVVPVPKERPARDETYLRWVATLPCAHCGKAAPSQAAHADQGKGMGIKASDLTAYPLCADSPGRLGCHSIIGAGGTMPRELRRQLEQRYAQITRALHEEQHV